MSLGLWVLLGVGVLVLMGVMQRVLDRMRLRDRTALILMAAIFIGGLIPDIRLTNLFSFNIGGALIPLGLCVYLFIKAGTGKERVRAIVAAILGAGVVYFLGRVLPAEPERTWLDPNYLYGLAAGLVAYILGRSRRSAFIGGVMGLLLADTFIAMTNWYRGIMQPLRLGGGGALDAVILSGLLAVALCELIGEIRERAMRGTEDDGRVIQDGQFVPAHAGKRRRAR